MMNVRMTVAYDGTRFSGWQKQSNAENTVQGILEKTIGEIAGQKVEITGAGRTDAGVHALAQTASFELKAKRDLPELMKELNGRLPGDIAVTGVEEADERFHARYNAKSKIYLYRVYTGAVSDPFRRKFVYRQTEPLDVPAMRAAAAKMTGRHDFVSFSAGKRSKKSTMRTIFSIVIEEDIPGYPDEIHIRYHGDGFLYNMARVMTGTLLDVGMGKRSSKSIPELFEAKERASAGPTAQPQGLFLEKVFYEEE